MLSLTELAALAMAHPAELAERYVGPLRIGGREVDVASSPAVMGCINLSRDSTYRESIATSTDIAVQMARVISAQGADLIDIGAESSTARADRVAADEQIAALVPVIERLTAEGITVSAETYEPSIARACLKAGARVLNLTGKARQEEIFDAAAEFDATVILCYVGGEDVREITDVPDADPIPMLLEHFGKRVEVARQHGVENLVIDPGMGFYYGNLVEPAKRVRHQATVLLNSFRLQPLGLPVCNALPHAFDVFGDQFRSAEGFFCVLATLGGTSLLRTHEVANVRAVLNGMAAVSPSST